MSTPSTLTQLQAGLIKGRWKVCTKIGQGAFGEIFKGRNVVTNEEVAIKVEKVDSKKQVLKLEVAVLKKLQNCQHVVPFVTCGRHGQHNYLVMELLGENISELRRRQASGRFSIATTCLLAIQMLESIKDAHVNGILHRDIKPSNFAMGLGPAAKNRVYMIDFGLSRRYLLPSGKVRPPREQSGFRGTARYASINAHLAKDLSRRDDLWSLLYMLIEFATGSLPWRRVKDKDQVGEMKIRCNTPELVADLPPEFRLLWEHLQTLRYEDEPDYEMLLNAFKKCLETAGGSLESPFDWEFSPNALGSRVRLLPSLSELAERAVCEALEDLHRPITASAPVMERMMDLALRMNPKLPEHCVLKLMNDKTTKLDMSVMLATAPTLLASALARCTSLVKMRLGDLTDGQAAELLRGGRAALFQELAFSAPNNKTLSPSKSIKPLLDMAAPSLKRLDVDGEAIKDSIVEQVLKSCVNLEWLGLSGCKRVKGTCFSVLAKSKRVSLLSGLDLSHCEISKSGFKAFIKICARLKQLRWSPLVAGFSMNAADMIQAVNRTTQLELLDVRCDLFELDSTLLELAVSAVGIRTLFIEGPGITDFGVQNVLTACNKIEHLALPCGDGISDASLQVIAKSCSVLKSLRLQFVTRANRNLVSEHALRSLLTAASPLEELALHNCLLLTLHTFPEEGLYTGMTRLCLSESLQMDDLAVERAVQLCPNVRHLDLSALNNLGPAALNHVAVWCLVLEELVLINCACFEDDAVAHAIRVLPLLFVRMSRFPMPSLQPQDVTLYKGNVDQVMQNVGNAYRIQALEKRKLYGTLYSANGNF